MIETDDDFSEIRKLYPGLTNEELQTAKHNLDRYLEVVIRIHDRVKNESENEI